MVSQLAMADIQRLQEQGITVEPHTVIRLNALALRMESARDKRFRVTAPRVIRVGGAQLHEPTVQSERWLLDLFETCAIETDTADLLRCYACAHANIPGFFDDPDLQRLPGVKQRVKSWTRQLTCTMAELSAAYFYAAYGDNPLEYETVSELALRHAGRVDLLDKRKQGESARDLLYAEIVNALCCNFSRATIDLLTRSALWAAVCRVYVAQGCEFEELIGTATGEYMLELQALNAKAAGTMEGGSLC